MTEDVAPDALDPNWEPCAADIVWLDDDRAGDPTVVGAKAANLARARAAGLPVLDGFAMPATWFDGYLARGLVALEQGGSGRARMAVTGQEPVGADIAADAAARLQEPLVVRSSATVEGEGTWAGAFASYAEIRADEIARAARGCAVSVFAVDSLERAAAMGVAPSDIRMASLVQPEITAEFGGVATTESDDHVSISWVADAPGAIVSGWERGHDCVVTVDGEVEGETGELGAQRALAIAALTRRAGEATGGNHVEWAVAEDTLWLLQCHTVAPPVSTPTLQPLTDERMESVVRNAIEYPGPVGEHFVLSWLLGSAPPVVLASENADAPSLLRRATDLRARLMQARSLGDGEAMRLLARLRSGSVDIPEQADVDPATAGDLLGTLSALAAALHIRGDIRTPGVMWHLRVAELERLVAGEEAAGARRFGTGSWEPITAAVVAGIGRGVDATTSVDGIGAGRLRLIRSADDAEKFEPREVVAAVYPLNNLAPLLFDAAGLVTVGGSPGAHVFEVAMSLGLPAVCGVDLAGEFGSLEELHERHDVIAAIDGTAGKLFYI